MGFKGKRGKINIRKCFVVRYFSYRMKHSPSINLDQNGLRSMLNGAKCGLLLAAVLGIQSPLHAADPSKQAPTPKKQVATSTNQAPATIKFSPSGDDVALPDNNAREHKSDGPLKGGSAESSEMYELPTASPTTPSSSVLFNNKKLQELIDQRKNWIYMTPEMSMESESSDLGIPKASKELGANDLFDKGGKSKKVVERYMESQDKQNSLRARSNLDRLDDDLSLGKEDKSLGTGIGKASNPMAASSPITRFNSAISQSTLTSSVLDRGGLGYGLKTSGYQDYSTQMRMESDLRFQQLLRPSTSKAPANGTPNDPMRLLADGTSQELQPVTGKSLEDIAAEKPKSTIDPFGDPNQGAFPRGFGSVNPTIMGQSSLSPAIIAPVPTSRLMAQPAVLPLPKRKF